MRKTAPWRENKKLVAQGFGDLKYVPRERCGWDSTLACLAYGVRMDIERRQPDLNSWAARHGVPASARYEEIGRDALVLWHGTTRKRAEAIAKHGLFHKKGVWAALHPSTAHGYCRGRAERYGTEGAVVCVLLGRQRMVEEMSFEVERNENILRFHRGLPPDYVEYVLVREEIRFTGAHRARTPRPWPAAKLKKRSGAWVPAQNPPVRYSDSESYSTPQEFARIALMRLLAELTELAALEVFSCLYSTVRPWEAVAHEDVLHLVEEECVRHRHRGKWRTFRARRSET